MQQHPEARIIKGPDAHKNDVTQLIPNSDIIHFATHAKTYNQKDNALSFVAFTNTSNDPESSRLYLNEIKNLTLDAEMIVLSACESGLGQKVSGEVTSIARSFMVSGAKSVISTLWTINDQSSSIIMDNYYRYLNQGIDKGQSMRKAKIDYIATVDPEYSHPYYWAAMKVQGNNSPLVKKSNGRIKIGSLIFVSILGLIFIWINIGIHR